MGKAAYPGTADLAAFLTGTGLFPSVPITAAGTTTLTHTVAATVRMRVGDGLYFGGAGVFRNIIAIPSTTTVTVDGVAFSTVLREPVTLFPGALDLGTAVLAGIQAFEADTRKFLATADQTRYFNLPTNPRGFIDLKADLASLTSVAIQGVTQVLNSEYRMLPEDADEEQVPWSHLQFSRRWIFPLEWTNVRAVTVVGKWAYGATPGNGIPEDAWNAMLMAGILLKLPMLAARQTRGVVSWGEADVNESYGQDAFKGLFTLWDEQLRRAYRRYDWVTVG